MLKIRLQRIGRINMPSYRLIDNKHTKRPKTNHKTKNKGTYNPRSKERALKDERIKYWMSVGAKPTDTVHNMLVSAGLIQGKKINVLPKYKAPEAPAEEAAPAPAAEASAAEAPAAEAPAAEAASEAAPEATPADAPTENA